MSRRRWRKSRNGSTRIESPVVPSLKWVSLMITSTRFTRTLRWQLLENRWLLGRGALPMTLPSFAQKEAAEIEQGSSFVAAGCCVRDMNARDELNEFRESPPEAPRSLDRSFLAD